MLKREGKKHQKLNRNPFTYVLCLSPSVVSSYYHKHMAAAVTSQLPDRLSKIDQSFLPRKFKVWCYQHTLYQQVMRHLKLCDITPSKALRMEAKANNYIRKWLGLPRVPFKRSAIWWKCANASAEIHQPGQQTGEGETRVPTERLTRLTV